MNFKDNLISAWKAIASFIDVEFTIGLALWIAAGWLMSVLTGSEVATD